MSVLLAGGFRDRSDTDAEPIGANPCACRLGTYAAD